MTRTMRALERGSFMGGRVYRGPKARAQRRIAPGQPVDSAAVDAGSNAERLSLRAAAGLAIGACAVALLLHQPGFRGPFISDDLLYLEHNAALSLPLGEALRKVTLERYYVVGNWSPLHQLFLLAEWRAFGANPLPYRLVNALLHALVALAMVAAGRRAGLSRAAAIAAGAIFLVHPVAAEPVGWINQSKTLLSVGFSLLRARALARLAARAARADASSPRRSSARSRCSRSPRRFRCRRCCCSPRGRTVRRAAGGAPRCDLIPLATIGAIAFALGLAAQAEQGGVAPWFGGGPLATAQVLPWLTWRYVRLVFAPFDLVHGVHPAVVAGSRDPRLLWPAAALVAVAILVVRACTLRRERWLYAAWFLGMLLPVIQVIPMINLFADRYLYAALPGALWLIADVVDTTRASPRAGRAARDLRRGDADRGALRGLRARTRAQVGRSRVALSRGDDRVSRGPQRLDRARRRTPEAGRSRRRRRRYLQSLAVFRDDGHVRHLLGRVRLAEKRPELALYDFETSLLLAPDASERALDARARSSACTRAACRPAPTSRRPLPRKDAMSAIEIRRIDHVVLRVRDVAASKRFYCDALGCSVERESDALGLHQLRAGASLIDLVPVAGPLGKLGGAGPGAEGRNVDHVALSLARFDDAAIARASARARRRARATSPSATAPTAWARRCTSAIPDGNVVELKGPPR